MNSFETFEKELEELIDNMIVNFLKEIEDRIVNAYKEECETFDDNNRSLYYRAGVENMYHRLKVIFDIES